MKYLSSLIVALLATQVQAKDVSVSVGKGMFFNDNEYVALSLENEMFKTTLMGISKEIDAGFVASSIMYKFTDASGVLFFNVGGAYLSKTNWINGTKYNFALNSGVKLADNLAVEWWHYSNGAQFGIGPKDKPNHGWNFIGVNYGF